MGQAAFEFVNRLIALKSGVGGPFGTRIAYVEKDGRNFTLKESGLDGSDARKLGEGNAPVFSPSVSRAGRIFFLSYARRIPEVFGLDRRKMKLDSVIENRGRVYGARVSPDGAWLVAATSSFGAVNLDLYDSRGGFLRRLTQGNWIDATPSFSPDGSYIAFASNRSGTVRIYTMPVEGGAAEPVSKAENQYCTSPAWSPDGQKIVYSCRTGSGNQIFMADLARPAPEKQLTWSGWNEDPVFSPDGQYLLLSHRPALESPARLALFSLLDFKLRLITPGNTDQRQPVWLGKSSQ